MGERRRLGLRAAAERAGRTRTVAGALRSDAGLRRGGASAARQGVRSGAPPRGAWGGRWHGKRARARAQGGAARGGGGTPHASGDCRPQRRGWCPMVPSHRRDVMPRARHQSQRQQQQQREQQQLRRRRSGGGGGGSISRRTCARAQDNKPYIIMYPIRQFRIQKSLGSMHSNANAAKVRFRRARAGAGAGRAAPPQGASAARGDPLPRARSRDGAAASGVAPRRAASWRAGTAGWRATR